MTFLNATHANTRGHGLSLTHLKINIAERFARYRTYRTTFTELSSLSNRDLADLGMSRQSIRSIAYETAYGAKD